MSSPRTIVVFLATGLQGSALINALSRHNTPAVQYNIIALTRNASSGSAQRLASLPGVKVSQVGKDHQERPLEALQQLGSEKDQVYGIFSCQAYVDDEAMFRQGKAIADAAVELGVKHLVYSSSDNGDLEDCGISGFEVKHKVERYIQTLPSLRYTFLRPVQFMENFLPDSPFLFKMGRTVTMRYTFYSHPERKHQVISSADIGRAGARAFVQGPEWMDGKVRLAGDSLTVKEIDQELGEPVQLTYGLLARFVKRMVPILRDMATFFDEHGYNVDVDALRREMPELEDLRTFLRRYKENKRA